MEVAEVPIGVRIHGGVQVVITEHVAEGERDSAPEHAAVWSISSGDIRLRHRVQAEPSAVRRRFSDGRRQTCGRVGERG